MKKVRVIALLLCVVMLLSLFTACGKSKEQTPDDQSSNKPAESDTTPAQPDSKDAEPVDNTPAREKLAVAVTSDIGTLDPLGLSQGGYTDIAFSYMEPLWDYKSGTEDMRWVLASSVDEASPTELIVHLREGVTFSNGSPFTADDVLFTLQLWKEAPNRALTVQQVDFENTKVIDDYTLDLCFNTPAASKMVLLTLVLIADKETYDAEAASTNPIGTGPYIVKEYVINSHMIATAREDYWGEKPQIKELEFRVLSEESQRVNALETGLVDISPVPSQDVEYVQTLDGFRRIDYHPCAGRHVLFNVNEACIFHDIDARRAVCHAIDKEAIVNIVYGGYATVLNNPISSYARDYDPSFDNLDDMYSVGYNPELAKQYAEKSGLVNESVRIMTNGTSEYVAMAEVIQAALGAIGVKATIENYDQATLRAKYRTDPTFYDICLYNTGSPDAMLATIFQGTVVPSEILSAPGAWEGVEEFIELNDKAIITSDRTERQAILLEMFKIFEAASPFYGIADTTTVYAVASDIGEFDFYNGAIRYQLLTCS